MGKVSPQRSPQETRRQRAQRTRRPRLTVGKASPIALRQVPLPPREFPPCSRACRESRQAWARKAPAPARKGYEETTLADLEDTKMSGMQKGIIAVALIGIVAFIVYYVAFMG